MAFTDTVDQETSAFGNGKCGPLTYVMKLADNSAVTYVTVAGLTITHAPVVADALGTFNVKLVVTLTEHSITLDVPFAATIGSCKVTSVTAPTITDTTY